MTARVLDTFAANRWIDDLEVSRVGKTMLRCLLSKVDARTGASHPRFPIFQAALASAASYSISQLCVGLGALEKLGLIRRRVLPARRRVDGTLRQDATDYELSFPDTCWRALLDAGKSLAARVADVLPAAHTLPWSINVQGKLSTQDASPKTRHAPRSWDLDPTQPTTFVDDMHYDKLAPKLLEAAQFVAAGVDDSIRERAVVCLNALRERAHDIALLACNLDLSSWDAVNCVKHWVARCVANARQRVDSAEHAINILRKFFLEQQAWAATKGAERIDERTRAKYKRFDDEAAARAGDVEREAMRKKCAHIKVGRGEYVAPAQVDEVPIDFGYDPNDPAIPF